MNIESKGTRRGFPALKHGLATWAHVLALASGLASAREAPLSLAEALRLAADHPAREAARLESRARAAEATQAGRFSSPRLSLEAENFAGSGAASGARALETTTRLEQTLELGGKRALRRGRAEAEAAASRAAEAARARTAEQALREAFAEAAFRAARAALLADAEGGLRGALETARRRRAAGGGGVGEEETLALRLAALELDAARNAGETERLRARVARWTGLAEPPRLAADTALAPVPDSARVASLVDRHPDLARWKAEQEALRFSERSARAQNIPDLDLNAGVRHLGAGGDWALVGGVSLPLPLWGRNTGGAAAAGARARAGENEGRALRRELESEALARLAGLRALRAGLERHRAELLPKAARLRASAQAAYAGGKLPVLELLDAQETWMEMNERHLALLLEYRTFEANLEALAGVSTTLAAGEGNTP